MGLTHQFPERLKEAREAKGLNRSTLSRQLLDKGLEVTDVQIKNWENGTACKLDLPEFKVLAGVLGVEVTFLLPALAELTDESKATESADYEATLSKLHSELHSRMNNGSPEELEALARGLVVQLRNAKEEQYELLIGKANGNLKPTLSAMIEELVHELRKIHELKG